MPLGGGDAIWYRLQMPAVAAPARAVFTVTFPGTDSVELFRPDGAGGWRSQRAGDSVPVSAMAHALPVTGFPFTVHPAEAQATYLRVRTPIRSG